MSNFSSEEPGSGLPIQSPHEPELHSRAASSETAPTFTFSHSIPGSNDSSHGEYGFYFLSNFRRDMVISLNTKASLTAKDESIKQPIYFMEISEFTRNKPDVTLHAVRQSHGTKTISDLSSDDFKSDPVIGIVYFPKLSRHMKLSISDPSLSPDNANWEDLKCTSWLKASEYHFSFNGKEYMWQRTKEKEDGVQGGTWRRKMAIDNYKLVDTNSGETMAVFIHSWRSFTKRGSLKVFVESEQDLKSMVFLSCAAILEKSRRRANARHSVGGGGA